MTTPGSSRTISLSPELSSYIEDLANAGYGDPTTIIRTALEQMRDRTVPISPATESLIGGGECGLLVRQRDWSATSLGPIDTWPAELRVTLANILNSPVAKVVMWGRENVMLYNDSYRAVAGDRHPAALGTPVATAFPEVWEWNSAILDSVRAGEIVAYQDQPILFHRDRGSETLTLDLFYTPVYQADRTVGGVLCTMVDNTGRVDAEHRLAASEAALRRVTDAVPMLISYVDRDHVYRLANAHYQEWLGTAPEDMIGTPVRDVIGNDAYLDRRASLDRALAGESFTTQTLFPHRDGRPRRSEFRYVPHYAADGSIPGLYVLGIDVEERAEREAELAMSNGRFRTAMDAVHGVLWTNSPDGRMIGEQPGWATLTGQSIAEYQNFGWADAIHPDDVAATIKAWTAAVLAKSMFVFEHRVRGHCGTWRTFAVRSLPILDDSGEVREWVGVHTDITSQREAEAALRDQAEALARQVSQRERAEEQLRQLNETLEARVIREIDERRHAEAKLTQSQKMETVGKLTGGVAHDFNNLLQVVSGNLQLLGKNLAGNERAERWVANAMAGVARGSKLAAQLLAFGRRQALEPKVVNVTRFVRGMDDMLRRAIGEGVEIETVVGGGLWNNFYRPCADRERAAEPRDQRTRRDGGARQADDRARQRVSRRHLRAGP
ncbi:MAG TPA: PAS domain-containing protein [Sphingomonas sp.]|nr:PAS domain-containing protein [Sphingomonas sp.]